MVGANNWGLIWIWRQSVLLTKFEGPGLDLGDL
jgi:hypothetical protein